MAGMQTAKNPDETWKYPTSKDVLKAVGLMTIGNTLEFDERPSSGSSLTDPFLRFAGMEKEREALCVARFGGSSLCHLTMRGPYPRGTKRTKEETIFRWASNLYGWAIVW
jgi:hypothetical protein